ncbi:helix-turn-helix domain-containing protein [Chitinophaga barathri]|nr:helix-turn-helix transcriptional regulator [Chitinophaga barathri]
MERVAIGQTIRKIREAAGFSLRELAALSEVDHADIARIEKAETNAGLANILELAFALKVPPEDFFTGDLKKIKPSSK